MGDSSSDVGQVRLMMGLRNKPCPTSTPDAPLGPQFTMLKSRSGTVM